MNVKVWRMQRMHATEGIWKSMNYAKIRVNISTLTPLIHQKRLTNNLLRKCGVEVPMLYRLTTSNNYLKHRYRSILPRQHMIQKGGRNPTCHKKQSDLMWRWQTTESYPLCHRNCLKLTWQFCPHLTYGRPLLVEVIIVGPWLMTWEAILARWTTASSRCMFRLWSTTKHHWGHSVGGTFHVDRLSSIKIQRHIE